MGCSPTSRMNFEAPLVALSIALTQRICPSTHVGDPRRVKRPSKLTSITGRLIGGSALYTEWPCI